MQVEKLLYTITNYIKADSKFLTNVASLGLVQFTNFVLPLLVYPYLFRTVGDSYFGCVAYALNIMIYLTIFADFGFNLSAPRSVALSRDNSLELSRIVSRVLQTKLYLFLLCCVATAIGVNAFPRLESEAFLYGFGLVYVAGGCVLPVWLFQGMEDMRHLTWINLVAKIGSTLLIILVVRDATKYKYVVGLFGIANLLSGSIGIMYAFRKYGLTFYWQPIHVIWNEIRSSWYIFLSNFSTVVFSNSVLIILGFFATNEVIGSYGIAEKITFTLLQLISVFLQATYPNLCRLASDSHKSVLSFMRRYYISFTIIIAFLCFCTSFYADELIQLATGSTQAETINLLRILSFLPFIVCLNAPAYQMLLIYKKEKYNAKVFNIVVLLSLLICTIMASNYGAVGAAYAAVITQILVTLLLHWGLERHFSEYTLWTTRK